MRGRIKAIGLLIAGLAAMWVGAGAPVDLQSLLKL
jgi:hypothetical protein